MNNDFIPAVEAAKILKVTRSRLFQIANERGWKVEVGHTRGRPHYFARAMVDDYAMTRRGAGRPRKVISSGFAKRIAEI